MAMGNNIFRLLGFSLILLAMPVCAFSETLKDELIARDAYDYATDVANIKATNILNTLKKQHDKELSIDNNEEQKTTYIQCGSYPCDLETNICWQYCRTDKIDPETGKSLGVCDTYEYSCLLKGEEPPSNNATQCFTGCDFKKTVFGIPVRYKKVFDGSDGNKYSVDIGDKITLKYANEGKNSASIRGCEVLPVKLYNARKCFFCPLFSTMYKVSGEITAISFKNLATAFATILMLGLALWVAVQTLTQVSSLTKQDAPKFLTNLIKQSYKVLIAFLLLQYSTQIFELGITPVLKAGLAFGNAMLDERYSVIKTSDNLTDDQKMEEQNPGITKRRAMLTNTTYFDGDLYLNLDNFVVNVQRNISFMQGIGSSLICIGGHGMITPGSIITFGAGFMMMIQGILLAAFAFLMAIAFAFYLLDAVVQLGLAGALMPFLIASWPFKITAKYSKIGWNMILNSVFIFMFAGMVITVDLNLVSAAVNFTVNEQTDTVNEETCQDAEHCEVKMGSLYAIAKAINTQNEKELVNLTDISGVGFLILLFCCIFGFKFIGQTKEMAGAFASGALKPIAPSIATIGASAAKSFALKTTQSTREAIGRHLKGAPKKLWGKIRGAFAGGGGEEADGAKASGGQPLSSGLGSDADNSPDNESEDNSMNVSENSDSGGVRPVAVRQNPAPQSRQLNEGAAAKNTPVSKSLNEGSIARTQNAQNTEDDSAEKLAGGKEASLLKQVKTAGKRKKSGYSNRGSRRARTKRINKGKKR